MSITEDILLQDDWYQKMKEKDIDVILCMHLYVASSRAQNDRDRHVASDWDFMIDFLKRIDVH